MHLYIFLPFSKLPFNSRKCFDFNQPFLSSFLCREIYPRVLECILQTELPELMLSHKDEILATLDAIANDTGKRPFEEIEKEIEKKNHGKAGLKSKKTFFPLKPSLMSVHVYGEKRKELGIKNITNRGSTHQKNVQPQPMAEAPTSTKYSSKATSRIRIFFSLIFSPSFSENKNGKEIEVFCVWLLVPAYPVSCTTIN